MSIHRSRDIPVQDVHIDQIRQVVGQPVEKLDKNRKKKKINTPAKKMKGKKTAAK